MMKHPRRALMQWAGAACLLAFALAAKAQTPASGGLGMGDRTQTTPGTVVNTPQVRAELLAHAPQGVKAGQTIWLGLQLTHQPHWHTYWKNSGDSGMPTQLEWQLPAGLVAGEMAWPTPKTIPIGPLANYGYEGTVLLPVPVKVSPAFHPKPFERELSVRLNASWLVCKLECIPEQGQFEIKLPLQGSVATSANAFEGAWATIPKAIPTPAGSSLTIEGRALQWKLAGLPAQWQGQTLALYPETPEITTPSAPLEQSWSNGVWQGRAPMAAHRGSDPSQMPVVLALPDGSQALRLILPVKGAWPARYAASEATGTGAFSNAGALVAQPKAPTPASDASPAAWGSALLLAFLGALLGGLLLNLMPCVFPILAIKALQLTQAGQTPAMQRNTGMAYTAGVVLSTLGLGAVLLVLRAAGQNMGWGFQLQSPLMVMALAALFVLIAMNLLGGFEVGQWAPQGLTNLEPPNPVMSAFLAGVLAVAVASPCSAPFMGAAMGLALTVPAWQALLIFAALGLGLSLPFLILGFVPALAQRLPKPGQWMETFKHVLAFPMLATTVWLVWVLGQQNGIDAAAALLMLLLALAFAAWVFDGWQAQGQTETRQSHHHVILGLAAMVLFMAGLVFGPVALRSLPATPGAAVSMPAQGSQASAATWQDWSPEVQSNALAAGHSVFVDYTAAWCVTCQFNKQSTLNRAEVLAAFQAKKVLLLRADWTRPNPVIAQSLAQLGRSAVPVYVLHTPGKAPQLLPELLSPSLVQQALAQLP